VTTYRLMDGVSGRPGAGSSGTQPPASASAFSGNYLSGTSFQVTSSGLWLTGYWWYCCASGQQATAVDFALWQITAASTGTFVPGSHATSGTLTPGAFNFTALPVPIALMPNTSYIAQVGYVSTTGFPLSQNQFATGDPYASGITNGPLNAPQVGAAVLHGFPQGSFSSANGADPTAGIANSSFNDSNFWMDVSVSDVPPAGATYRLFPSVPTPVNQTPDTANNFTLANEFELSQPCSIERIWFYSQPGATQLPTEVGIWQISGTSLVPGTHLVSPSWSGAAGSGWISVSYSGVILNPGPKYKVSVFNGAATPSIWNVSFLQFWNIGPGLNGITTGPLSAPNLASAAAPGQGTYHQGASFAYPDTYDSTGTGDNYWVDIEVTIAPTVATGAGGDENRQTALKKLDWLLLYLYVCVHGRCISGTLIRACGMSLSLPRPSGNSRCRRCSLR
jgi:Domain of unknown function (DUF4082)